MIKNKGNMFWPDVIDLKQFYASQVGQVACRLIQRAVRHYWPEAPGESLLGIGYTTPYLEPYLDSAMSVAAFMPSGQGGLYWPAHHDNRAALVDEGQLPLPKEVMNRVLVVHALENSEQVRNMLKEVWRVLTPGGRLLVVVPNRLGFWARSARSPFGYGHPYSSWQLRKLLADSGLTPLRSAHALFIPPVSWRLLLRIAHWIETIFDGLYAGFGGVVIMEAEKQIYAPTRLAVSKASRLSVYIPGTQPAMSRNYFR